MNKTVEAIYTEDSVCPQCGGILAAKLLQKGIRLKCANCRFFVYPQPGQMSEQLLNALLAHVGHQIGDARTHLNKYTSSLQAGGSQVLEE
ncbi:MAG: hypothetical protein AB7T17_06810 [Geobacter sp.]